MKGETSPSTSTFFLLWFLWNSSMFAHIKHEEKPSPLPIAQRNGSFGLGLLSFSSAFSRRLKMVDVGRLFSLLVPSFYCLLLVLESLMWITPK